MDRQRLDCQGVTEFRILGYDEKGAAVYGKSALSQADRDALKERTTDLSDINEKRKAAILMEFKRGYDETKADSKRYNEGR